LSLLRIDCVNPFFLDRFLLRLTGWGNFIEWGIIRNTKNMQDQATNLPEYEEANLRHTINILVKNKIFIIGIVLASAIIAFAFSSSLPKVFEVKAVLQIGTMPVGGKLVGVVSPADAAKKINADFYQPAVCRNLKISQNDCPHVGAQVFSDDFIALSARSSDADKTKSVLQETGRAVAAEYEAVVQKKRATAMSDIETYKNDAQRYAEKMRVAENDARSLEAEIRSLRSQIVAGRDVSLQIILSTNQNLLEAKQQDAEKYYSLANENTKQMETTLDLLTQIKPTEIFSGPETSSLPVSPRIWLNTMVAAILGLILGVFLVFAADWWRKTKSQ